MLQKTNKQMLYRVLVTHSLMTPYSQVHHSLGVSSWFFMGSRASVYNGEDTKPQMNEQTLTTKATSQNFETNYGLGRWVGA